MIDIDTNAPAPTDALGPMAPLAQPGHAARAALLCGFPPSAAAAASCSFIFTTVSL